MKIKPKIKNTSKRKTKKLSSRLRLVDHRHTGRLIHRNHTSYLALVIILLIDYYETEIEILKKIHKYNSKIEEIDLE